MKSFKIITAIGVFLLLTSCSSLQGVSNKVNKTTNDINRVNNTVKKSTDVVKDVKDILK